MRSLLHIVACSLALGISFTVLADTPAKPTPTPTPTPSPTPDEPFKPFPMDPPPPPKKPECYGPFCGPMSFFEGDSITFLEAQDIGKQSPINPYRHGGVQPTNPWPNIKGRGMPGQPGVGNFGGADPGGGFRP